jgi:hypothetical protein
MAEGKRGDAVYSDVAAQVVHREGRVHMIFSRYVEGTLKKAEMDHLILMPQEAVNAAEVMTTMAFEADTSLKPVGDTLKPALVEQIRKRMGPKAIMIIRTGIIEKTAPDVIARQVLDHFCSEAYS